jgi:16S rRNA (cytidine1402-2'-O)-methyltransferase
MVIEDPLDPGLYIVATPIGNLGDITKRAVDILARCDAVACEDTRMTAKLLNHLGIRKPLWRYDDHSSDQQRANLLSAMRDKAVALVSDAGTPLISDPGFRLVRSARDEGIPVTSLPGPSALVVAITLCGLPSDRFLFAGFLPNKDKARDDTLDELARVPATLVFYESAQRLVKALLAVSARLPGREVAVARELTKAFEECRRGSPGELALHYENYPPKGEIVLMIGPPSEQAASDLDVDSLLIAAMEQEKPSQAAAQVAKATGMDRKALYGRALELRKS